MKVRLPSLTTAVAIVLSIGAATALADSATAATNAPPQGNNACAVESGVLSFSPALTTRGGGQRDYVTMHLQLGRCSRAGAGTGSFEASPSFFLSDNSCHSLFIRPPAADPVAGTIRWRPGAQVTDVSFTGRSTSFRPSVRLHLSGGTAYGGAFSGSAKSVLVLRPTKRKIAAVCSTSRLSRLLVRGGFVDVGPSF